MNKQRERLTTDKTKIFVRENITLMSVTKDELRRHYNEIFDRLQEYEVAEETGQIIVPPCKVGDTAHFLIEDPVLGEKYISSEPITDVCTKGFYTSGHEDSDENGDLWPWSDVGEIVFFDKTKAEEALKGGGRDVIC